jgi:GDPmannose 4,6-dehydratase
MDFNSRPTESSSSMKTKRALITGVTGQDGSYLADYLLELGYEVHGLVRHSSVRNTKRIEHLLNSSKFKNSFFLHDGDLTDPFSILEVLRLVKPCEVYNLASQSHVKVSYSVPEFTSNVNAIGPLRILEAVRILGWQNELRFYQASTSELFGENSSGIYNETEPLAPNNPYAISKLYAYWTTRYYRETFGFYASNGFLFSHESPRRGENFVSRKIVMAVARIAKGSSETLKLGNLEVQRDWGHARDYVRGIHAILSHDNSTDFVLATGKIHSLREFTEQAFKCADIEIEWSGTGLEEVARSKSQGRTVLEIDPTYFRPNLERVRRGDASKALKLLNWEARIGFNEMVNEMVTHELTTS